MSTKSIFAFVMFTFVFNITDVMHQSFQLLVFICIDNCEALWNSNVTKYWQNKFDKISSGKNKFILTSCLKKLKILGKIGSG